MRCFALILLLSLWVAPAHAHKASDSYLALSVGDEHVSGQWDIALRDLDYAIGLDAEANGEGDADAPVSGGEPPGPRQQLTTSRSARPR